MSDTMKLALQLTAVDMLSGVLSRAKSSISSLGDAGRKVKKDFDIMEQSITRGLKAIAVSAYTINKLKPGVSAAADLQEAMLGVKMNLAGSAKNAKELTSMLSKVKGTAITVSADAPFSAEDVVRIENSLLKAGLDLEDVTGKSGAAFAATALASLSGEAPEMIGDALAAIGTQFSLKGEGYSEFADWLVRVDDAGSAKVPLLISGLRMAGSQANAIGISAKDSVTSLGALAVLGERAGSAYNNFLGALIAKGNKLKRMDLNFFEQGEFIGMDRVTAMLKERFGDIADTQKRLNILQEIFGEEGGRAANEFINSAKGFREIEDAAKDSLSMAEKMTIWGEGMNAALAKLGGTARSTLANLFNPLLKPLKEFIDLLNQGTSKLGEMAAKSKVLAGGVSYGMAAVALGAGGYGMFNLLKGGLAGTRVLKGVGGIKGLLGGFSGTAAGIAKGKAVEAATGVTPVFVTNWPATMGAAGMAADMATGSPGGILKKSVGWLKKLPGLSVGAAGAGTTATAGIAALAAGAAAGTIINKIAGWVSGKLTDDKYSGSGWLGNMFYDWRHPEDKKPETKNNINLNVRIDEKGRVFTESDNMNTELNTTLNRGKFFK